MKKTIIALLALAGAAAGETITLNIPTGIQNAMTTVTTTEGVTKEVVGGYGSTNVEGAITKFANSKDGGYMFNSGGVVNPDTDNGEGVITSDQDKGTCLTLYGRTGAGGSGEAIVLSASELSGFLVESFTFSIAGSTCSQSGKSIGMTLAVIEKNSEGTWVKHGESETGSFLTGAGDSIVLTLGEAINWSDSYKVVAIVDNQAKSVDGGTTPYSMNGISVSATYTIPEPATATLSLLALCGLAARRRRKRWFETNTFKTPEAGSPGVFYHLLHGCEWCWYRNRDWKYNSHM